jgi:hypothetical protein
MTDHKYYDPIRKMTLNEIKHIHLLFYHYRSTEYIQDTKQDNKLQQHAYL